MIKALTATHWDTTTFYLSQIECAERVAIWAAIFIMSVSGIIRQKERPPNHFFIETTYVFSEPTTSRQYEDNLAHFGDIEVSDGHMDYDEATSAELQTLDASIWKKKYELAQLELESTQKKLVGTQKKLVETQKELKGKHPATILDEFPDYQQAISSRNLEMLQQAMLLKQTKEDSTLEVAQLRLKLAETEKKLTAVLTQRPDLAEKEIIID